MGDRRQPNFDYTSSAAWPEMVDARSLGDTSFQLPPMQYEDYPEYRSARRDQQNYHDSALRYTRHQQEIRESALALNQATAASFQSFTSGGSVSPIEDIMARRDNSAPSWLLNEPFHPSESLAVQADPSNVFQSQASDLNHTVDPNQLWNFNDQYHATNYSTSPSTDEIGASSEDDLYSATPSEMDYDETRVFDYTPSSGTTNTELSDAAEAIRSQRHNDTAASIPQNNRAQDVQQPLQSGNQQSTGTSSSDQSRSRRVLQAEKREQENELLLHLLSQGYNYKQVKQIGKFKAAESTLRGRHRALKKPKHERPRRPVWTENDVRLLRKAVDRYRERQPRGKISWKTITTWMKAAGSSHSFGYSACSKKYAEVLNKQGLHKSRL